MVLHILLLAILFIAAIFNLFFYFPTKKLSSWIHSLIVPTITSSKSSTDTSSSSKKEKTNTTTTTTTNNNNNNNRAELRRVFATFDKNSDGFITKEELRESLKNIRIFVTEREVEEMVLKLDANGDGLIDFEEFGLLCESMIGSGGKEEEKVKHGEESMLGNEEDLKEAFDVFDRDKDGLISVEELGSILSSLGLKEGKKMENCKEMIRKVDMDGDGMVNFEEFKRMMKSGGMLLLAS
ncbi:Parvalbumin [Trema orientale]|uniref:Parvalbumin n=1 Tax=Trema orientale TaxID=63057 RepID=A0A2P5FQ35_TREOI|nr:Parvalbumin [Trema orientale]